MWHNPGGSKGTPLFPFGISFDGLGTKVGAKFSAGGRLAWQLANNHPRNKAKHANRILVLAATSFDLR